MLKALGTLANQFHPVSLPDTQVQGRLASNCWQQTALFCVAAGLTGGLVGAQEAGMGFLSLAWEGANVVFNSSYSAAASVGIPELI